MKKLFVLLMPILFWSCAVKAEGGCPAGQRPYDTPQARQCVPIPGSSSGGYGGYWADRYAAVVWGHAGDGSPVYAWAIGAGSQQAADSAALASCKDAGHAECRVGLQFANGYFAIVRSQEGNLYAGSEFGWWGARRQAMSQCKRNGDASCKVVESQRSRSEWIE